MAIAEVIKFEGPQDALVWKFPVEDFNATSQLIVDETHEALLVVNGYAADLFPAGRRTLLLSNIPIARKLVEIPTGGESPFPCKVFFINKVHQMDLKWGTQHPIALNDPLYDIFMHVQMHGSMAVSVEDSRKFMLKLTGFTPLFTNRDIIDHFRGIISQQVKDIIAKIMIQGMLSYFVISAHLVDLSGVVKEKLDEVFAEYGVKIQYFNIETITVPEADYRKVSEAKELRTSRMIQGYTWQEERQMAIAEKFASNEGTMGSIGGAVGGFMMGGAMGSSVVDIARSALDPQRIPKDTPPRDAQGTNPHPGQGPNTVDVAGFFRAKTETPPPPPADKQICPHCNAELPANAKFCFVCGKRIQPEENTVVCPNCHKIVPKGKFCLECGFRLTANVCPNCHAELPEGAKFCIHCGASLQ